VTGVTGVPVAVARAGWYRDPWQVAWWRWWDGAAWTAHTSGPFAPVAGWYPDPWGVAVTRFWNGSAWTPFTGDAGAGAPARGFYPPARASIVARGAGMRGGGLAAAGIATGLVLSFLVGLLTYVLDGSPTVAEVFGEAALWTGLVGACVLAVRRHGTGQLSDLGLRRPRLVDFGIGAVGGIVARIGAAIIAAILIPLLTPTTRHVSDWVSRDLHRNWAAMAVTIVIAVVGAPIVEELFFRGLLQGALTHRYGPRTALWVQAGIFGVCHYQFGMPFATVVLTIVPIAGIGLVLGSLRWRYDRLAPGMVAHALCNVVAVVVLLALG
jgi:CAAX protease family protein